MESGIYILKTNEHFYIGLSSKLKTRKRSHLRHLRKNKHQNYKLQEVFNKGYQIEFEVLENVVVAELEDKEIWWFNKYKAEHPELIPLNLKECGSRPTYSWESKVKMSKTKCKREYEFDKLYNAIDFETNEFLATGTLLEISKWYGIGLQQFDDLSRTYKLDDLSNKRIYIIEALEDIINLDDIDYMNDW